MGELFMVNTTPAVKRRTPIWPVIIAPLVAGVYYLALKSAFVQSIVFVLGKTAATDIDLSDLTSPQWGSHWFYRGVAELMATSFGTFVAAGLARGRESAAAIVGGCIISLEFFGRIAMLIYAWKYMAHDDFSIPEPWYQYAIEVLMIFAPPAIGAYVAEAAEDMHRQSPTGFGGINRLHFLWLWFAAFWYALALITPLARIYSLGPDSGIIALFLVIIVNGLPAAAVAIPAYYGMTLLSGEHGSTMHPAGRNLVGVLVVVFGFIVGAVILTGWYWMFDKLLG